MDNEMRTRLLRFFNWRTFWCALTATIAYVVLAVSLPLQPFLEFIRILQATAACLVVVAFSGDAWESLTREKPEHSDSLIIGIFLQHVAIFWTGFWLLLYRLSGRQEWMLNQLWFGFAAGWLSSAASFLHIYPAGVLRPGDGIDEVPPARLRMAGVVAASGVFAILIVLATQPDVRGVLDWARAWLK